MLDLQGRSKTILVAAILYFLFAPQSGKNPNGLPAYNAPSADFHPPRAGKVSSMNEGRICDKETFESV
jgi:hypothetical protein